MVCLKNHENISYSANHDKYKLNKNENRFLRDLEHIDNFEIGITLKYVELHFN